MQQNSPSPLDRVVPIKNGDALLAYYFGLFAILPVFGLVLGVLAIWLGMKGLRNCNADPTLPGRTHAWVGIVLGGLFLAANLVIALAIFVLALNRPR